MTTSYSDLEYLVNYYNLTGSLAGTSTVPGIALSEEGGNYIVTYTHFTGYADIIAASYYDGADDEVQHIVDSMDYNSDIETALETILNPTGNYSALFSDVANIDFQEETSGTGTITFAQVDGGFPYFSSQAISAGVYRYLPGTFDDPTDRYGDIWINTDHDATDGDGIFSEYNFWEKSGTIQPGTTAYKILMEEISHALGIDIYDEHGVARDSDLNSQKYTVTSYNSHPDMVYETTIIAGYNESYVIEEALGNPWPSSLGVFDIAALQAIYGADTTTRLGDTTYKMGSGEAFGATASDAFVYTIWDAGGDHDTIDATGYSNGVQIDLREGHFSSIGKSGGVFGSRVDWDSGSYDAGNVGIAYGAEIEDAIGSSHDDHLIGNDLGNILIGGEGDDTLDGGDGVDTADYSQDAAAGGTGAITVDLATSDGNAGDRVFDGWGDEDTVSEIERFVTGAGNDTFKTESVGGRTFEGGAGDDTVDYMGSGLVLDLRSYTGTQDMRVFNSEGSFDNLSGIERATGSGRILLDGSTDLEALPFESYLVDPVYPYTSIPIAFRYTTGFSALDYSSLDSGLNFDLRIRDGVGGSGPYQDGAGNYLTATITGTGVNHSFDHWAGTIYGTNHGDTYSLHYFRAYELYTGTGDDTVILQRSAFHQQIIHYSGGDDTYYITDDLEEVRLDASIVLADITIGAITTRPDDYGFSCTLTIENHGTINLVYDGHPGDTIYVALDAGGVITFTNPVANGELLGFEANISGSSTVASAFSGNWGDNSWTGTDGYDQTYYAYGGNDRVIGADGNNTLYGGEGEDVLEGGTGDNILNAGLGDDVIYFGQGDDTASGGDGADTFILQAGSAKDSVITDFDIAEDTLILTNIEDATALGDISYTTDPGGDTLTFGNSQTLTLQGISFADLSSANIEFAPSDPAPLPPEPFSSQYDSPSTSGDIYPNTLFGSYKIYGLDGNDNIYGQYGQHYYMYGGTGNDSLYGGNGDDLLNGGEGFDFLSGGAGNDSYMFEITDYGFEGIVEEDGTDALFIPADLSKEELAFSISGDSLTISSTRPFFSWTTIEIYTQFADSGFDGAIEYIVVDDEVHDLNIVAQSGFSSASLVSVDIETPIARDDLIEVSVDEIVTGNVFADNGSGIDYDLSSAFLISEELSLQGAWGSFILNADGSFVLDPAVYFDGTVSFDYTLTDSDSNQSDATITLDISLPVNYMYGTAVADTLDGGVGDDIIDAGAGNDTLYGAGGDDTLDGGDGIDTADYSNAAAGVIVSLQLSEASDDGDEGSDTLTNIENVIGSAYNDQLRGNGADNELHGGAGDDLVYGADGTDYLYGDAGNDDLRGQSDDVDYLYGGADNDTLYGGAGDELYGGTGNDVMRGYGGTGVFDGGDGEDRIWWRNSSEGIEADLDAGTATDESSNVATIVDVEHLTGSGYADTFYGDSGNNTLDGQDGNDELHGRGGADTLYGRVGDDELYGDAGDDELYGKEDDDILDGGADNDTLKGGTGNDRLIGGTGDDLLYGEADNDTLIGGDGDDVLSAGAGTDVMLGGIGDDRMYGGSGVDTFGFVENDTYVDRAYDFTYGEDKINLTDLLSGFNSGTDDIDDFVAIVHTGARFDVWVDKDGTGTSESMEQIGKIFTNISDTLTAEDLLSNGTLVIDQAIV
nr:M10 family metallopeptidase C-terminal domain-containing protein [uncultured Hyphomonas sp.]